MTYFAVVTTWSEVPLKSGMMGVLMGGLTGTTAFLVAVRLRNSPSELGGWIEKIFVRFAFDLVCSFISFAGSVLIYLL